MLSNNEPSSTKKVLSAAFYGFSSVLIMVVNKSILTSYKFPSSQFLGLGQMVAAVCILFFGRSMGFVSFPYFNKQILGQIFPLPLLYFGNLVSGLGGTKHLSLPMFTVLRRFTILLTMILEFVILKKRASNAIAITVLTMIFGTLVAASNDLAFNFIGYVFVLSNDVFTASNNVFIKKKLNMSDLGKYGIIFYNSIFMIVPSALVAISIGDIDRVTNFEDWSDFFFIVQFLLSCFMGFILMFSITLCTAYNSALTTTVVGCIKNIAVTYIGMYFGGDYIFSWTNFIGINISVIGGIAYSYIAFLDKDKGGSKTTQVSKQTSTV